MRTSTAPSAVLPPPTCSSRPFPLRSFIGLRWSAPRFQVPPTLSPVFPEDSCDSWQLLSCSACLPQARERASASVAVLNGKRGCSFRLGLVLFLLALSSVCSIIMLISGTAMNTSKVLLESGPERCLSTEQIKGSSWNTSAAVRTFFFLTEANPAFIKQQETDTMCLGIPAGNQNY
jgi:hypothetical protein